MQRLIYSSQIPSKLHSNPHPCVPQLPSRTGSFVPATTPSQFGFGSGSIRFGLFSSRLQRLESNCLANPNGGPSTSSFCFSPLIDQNEEVLPPKARVVEKSEKAGWNPLKAFATAKIILLSVITITLIHPILPNPAFASFPAAAAAKTGGSVGNGLLRTEILTSAWTGFFAGCLHTLSGPDHLAALAPLSIGRTRMESAAVGALWGFGHEAGQVIFGLLFLLLKDRLHIEVIQTWGTRVVGLTLLVIGAMGIKEAMESHPTFVSLKNGEQDLSAYESNVGKKKIGFATFATGIVHGLQPDALMMVLPALALPSRVAGAAFLGMFLIGTVVAMGGYTVFIGSCSQALKDRIPRITEKLTWAASLIAIGLGLAILISQFFGFTLY